MSELDEKLDRFIKAVDLRLGEIERQLKEQRRADERISEDFICKNFYYGEVGQLDIWILE